MKKVISFILLFCMVAVMFVACTPTEQPGGTTTPAGTTAPNTPSNPGTTTAPDTGTGTPSAKLDKDNTTANFGGESIRILAWEDAGYLEFEYEENDQGMASINDAIRRRNKTVETNRGVKLEYTYQKGNYNNRDAYINKATQLDSGTADQYIDIYAAYSQVSAMLSTKGMCANLLKLTSDEGLNFDYAWWPDTMLNEAVYQNRLYICTGDISTNVLWWMMCLYFNKDLMETVDLDPLKPYKLVDEGKWTVDEFIAYCTEYGVTNDGDGTKDNDDTFGYSCGNDIFLDAFQNGAGFRFLATDSKGNLALSSTFATQAEGQLHTKLREFLHGPDSAFWYNKKLPAISEDPFVKGQALFTSNSAAYSHTLRLSDLAEFTYGVLPNPKLNTAQANYSTKLGAAHTEYAIGSSSLKKDKVAVVLQCLAAQSYIQITPVLFDEAMKLRYSPEVDDARMFDKLRETLCFDMGYNYNLSLSDYAWKLWRLPLGNNTAYLGQAQGSIRAIGVLIGQLQKQLLAADDGKIS